MLKNREERPLRVIDYVYGFVLVIGVLTASLSAGMGPLEADLASLTDETGSISVTATAYERPGHKDLLRGSACIPLRELLLNRAIPAIHSYSRSVACETRP